MPTNLPASASGAEVIALIDQWVELLEQEKYEEAFSFIEAEPFWNAALLKEVIKSYGDEADNRVTLRNNGTALDGAGNVEKARQRKETEWHSDTHGDVWYDLNINHLGSDLTATFDLIKENGHLRLVLRDIHVM